MNKQKQSDLAEGIKCLVRDGVQSVLDGKAKRFWIRRFNAETIAVTPALVQEILEKAGWTAGEFETNGWQYDWWLPFTKGKKSFTAFGSGFYGGLEFYETETA